MNMCVGVSIRDPVFLNYLQPQVNSNGAAIDNLSRICNGCVASVGSGEDDGDGNRSHGAVG